MIRSVTAVAALGVLAACATTPAPQIVAQLGADPVLAGGEYDSGGGITVAVDLREAQGKTMVCGVWAESRQQSVLSQGEAKGVLDTGSVSVGGETILRGLRFMAKVPPMADYAGQEGQCTLTARPWQPGNADRQVHVDLPRQVVRVEGDDEGGLFQVWFWPTGPGAGDA